MPKVNSVDGGVPYHRKCAQDGLGCGESMIDLDIAYSLIWPQTVIVYQVLDRHYAKEELAGKLLGYLNVFLDAVRSAIVYSFLKHR